MHSLTLLLTTLPLLSQAHFLLNYPQPLGYPTFNEDTESDSPCGGPAITFGTNDTNITVAGFQLASRTTHPEANWLFRATLSTQEPFNWTVISPVISQSGLGDFCATNLSLPAEFVGQRGIIQVTQGAVDGDLYQCAAVNFVEGSTTAWPSACVNASGVTTSVTTQTTLDDNSTTTGSATSASASSTASGAAMRDVAGGLLAMLPVGLLLL